MRKNEDPKRNFQGSRSLSRRNKFEPLKNVAKSSFPLNKRRRVAHPAGKEEEEGLQWEELESEDGTEKNNQG